MKNFILTFLSIFFLVLIGLLVYSLVIRGLWGNPTATQIKETINDETKPYGIAPDRGRFVLTQNLVENHSFGLSREQAEAGAPDVGYHKGKYYIYFGPGVSVMAMPFYILGAQYNLSQVATYTMVGLFSVLNLIFVFLISKKTLNLSYWTSIFNSIVFGFASTALSYATSLYQHEITTFLILSGFYFAWMYKVHRVWGFLFAILVWIEYGFSFFVDFPNAVLMAPVIVYLILNALKVHQSKESFKFSIRPSIILTSIFFVGVMILHGYYNQVNFGNWKTISGNLPGLKTMKEQGLSENDVDNKAGIKEKNSVGAIQELHLVNSSYELLIAPDKGIFIFSPIFILSFLGIWVAKKQNKINMEMGILIALIITGIFFYSSWGDPWGGWAYGPRYLIPVMAPLAVLVGFFLENFKYQLWGKILAIFLFCFSVLTALIGALTNNAVPPKVEADYLHSKYGILFNWDFIMRGKSGSFLYNYYLHNYVNLTEYLLYIFLFIAFIGIILIIIIPNRRHIHEH